MLTLTNSSYSEQTESNDQTRMELEKSYHPNFQGLLTHNVKARLPGPNQIQQALRVVSLPLQP